MPIAELLLECSLALGAGLHVVCASLSRDSAAFIAEATAGTGAVVSENGHVLRSSGRGHVYCLSLLKKPRSMLPVVVSVSTVLGRIGEKERGQS